MKFGSAITLIALCAGAALCEEPAAALARADIAVVAKVLRIQRADLAEIKVEEVLKGALTEETVRLRVPDGLPADFPSSGERRIFLLKRAARGTVFDLAGPGGVIPATLANVDDMIAAAEEQLFASGSEEIGPRPVAETVPLPPRRESSGDSTAPSVRPPVEPPGTGQEPPGTLTDQAPRPPAGPAEAVELPPLAAPASAPGPAAVDLTSAPRPSPAATEPEIVKGDPTKSPAPAEPEIVEPAPAPAADTGPQAEPALTAPKVTAELATRAAAADVVLMGKVASVELPRSAAERAVLAFVVDESLKGEVAAGTRVSLALPAPGAGGPVWRPRRCRAVAFARAAGRAGEFRLVHALYGVEPMGDESASARLLERLARAEGISAPAAIAKSPAAAISLVARSWRKAWNAKDLEATIRCYSSRSPLAKAYRRGGKSRERLAATLRDFPDTISLQVGDVKVIEGQRARASAALLQRRGDLVSRRTITMTFVLEGGRWLILREGF